MIAAVGILVFITIWQIFTGRWGGAAVSCVFAGFAYWTLRRWGWDSAGISYYPVEAVFAVAAALLYWMPKRAKYAWKAARG